MYKSVRTRICRSKFYSRKGVLSGCIFVTLVSFIYYYMYFTKFFTKPSFLARIGNSQPQDLPNDFISREKLYMAQLIHKTSTFYDGDKLQTVITDLLLNIRKLTIFAVHELNTRLTLSFKCGERCRKWWADPLNTIILKTSSFEDYYEHSIIFVGQPGNVPFYIHIRQNYIPYSAKVEWGGNELEFFGSFTRLDGKGVAPPDQVPAEFSDINDLELTSWRRNQSFVVGDYLEYSDEGMFMITPQGTLGDAKNMYCGEHLKMLIMVSSAPNHLERRIAIRETYGSDENLLNKNVRLVFLFGFVDNSTLQEMIAQEAEEFGDIIQADFMDAYHNLTLSHLAMYNWIQLTCERVGLPKYILKADDDFLLNVGLAMDVAYQNPSFELIGTPLCHTAPFREPNHKWYTPRYMYAPELYVGYLSGVAYLIRTDIIPRILKVSLSTPIIHMDDVYITGLLPRQLGIQPVGSPLFTYHRLRHITSCSLKKTVCSYAKNSEDLKSQWNQLSNGQIKCDFSELKDSIYIKRLSDRKIKECNYK